MALYEHAEYFAGKPVEDYVRGNEGLSLGALRHEKLHSLVIETGGLNLNIVREVCQSHLSEVVRSHSTIGASL